uniref:TIR domain-containing protein n=1 Tax=Schistosoma haematobium TaxID=6185 RepID=A0A094ZHD1_SCHHA
MLTYLLCLYFIDTMKLIRKYITTNSRKVIFPNRTINDNDAKDIVETSLNNEQVHNKTDWLIYNESNIGLVDAIPHILISYSHEEKDMAMYLSEQLENKGYKVWIDYKDMMYETDVMEEAQYAYHEKKPILFLRAQRGYVPDGWLGFMMGTRLYIDISGKYPFEDKFIELCKRIDVYKKQSIDQLSNHCQNKPIEVVCFISCLLL